MEDDEKKIDKTSDSTRAISIESEIDIVYAQSFFLREQPKIHGYLSPLTITESTASPFDCPIFLNVLSSCDRVEQAICRGNRGAAAIVNLLSTSVIPLFPEQSQN